jgi:hypothetical protein
VYRRKQGLGTQCLGRFGNSWIVIRNRRGQVYGSRLYRLTELGSDGSRIGTTRLRPADGFPQVFLGTETGTQRDRSPLASFPNPNGERIEGVVFLTDGTRPEGQVRKQPREFGRTIPVLFRGVNPSGAWTELEDVQEDDFRRALRLLEIQPREEASRWISAAVV